MSQKPLLSEFIGTMLLVVTVVGSGIMATALSGGNDGVALLGNTIATGAILYVLITILGPLSGAHFNPVVTLVMASMKEIPVSLALGYIIVQIIGGLCGTILAHVMFCVEILQLPQNARTGLPQYTAEVVATFGLLLTILLGRRARPDTVPMLVGLYITAGYWFTASTSFANPAVTIARTFTDSFSGIAFADTPYFIIAQIVGGFLGLAVSAILLRDDT